MSNSKTAGLLLMVLCIASCDRSKTKEQETAKPNDPAKAAPAAPVFDRVEYRTADGKSSITLTSPTDLEFRTPEGIVKACKYSEVDDTIHILVPGYTVDLIYTRTPGELLSADSIRYVDTSARESESTRVNRERALEAAKQIREAEDARIAAIIEESKKSKSAMKTFVVENDLGGQFEITVTDVSAKIRQKTLSKGQTALEPPVDIWFGDFERFVVAPADFQVLVLNGVGTHIIFKSIPEHDEVVAAIKSAWSQWRAKFPESEHSRVLRHGYVP